MRRGIHIGILFAMLIGMSWIATAAQEATPETELATDTSVLADLGYPELALTTDGESLDVPSEVEAGRYHLSLTNTGAELIAALELYQLPGDMTTDELLAGFEGAEEGAPPEWFYEMVSGGGVSTAVPGGSDSVIVDLEPGEWVFNLYTFTEDFSTDVNQPFTVNVTGDMPAVEDPDAAVEAAMIDYDFEITGPVPAGANVWKVANEGDEPHHLILSQVPDGTTEDEVMELVMAMFGPPASPEASVSPAEPALSFEDVLDVYETLILSSGRAMWAEVDLDPGTYVAICFIPSPDGTPHIMLGMIEIFTVE